MLHSDLRAKPRAEPGIKYLLAGYVFLALQPIAVRLLTEKGWSAASTVFARFAFSACAILVICIVRKKGLQTKNWRLLFLRGILGGAAVLLYFTSIQYAGAARGTLLNYTYPLWANLFSYFLGKKLGSHFWLALGVALMGTFLVVWPDQGWGDSSVGLGEAAGLASAFLAGGAVLTIKKLRETDEALTIIASFTFFGLLMSLPLADFEFARSSLHRVDVSLAASAVGLLAFFGHWLFTKGYRGASLQEATLLSLLVPLLAAFSGIVFLQEEFSFRFALGGFFILSSLAIVFFRAPPGR